MTSHIRIPFMSWMEEGETRANHAVCWDKQDKLSQISQGDSFVVVNGGILDVTISKPVVTDDYPR